jgi:hypothetical protein
MTEPSDPTPGRWTAWHGAYADPGSDLSQRLAAVRRRLRSDVEGRAGTVRLLSLCAGQADDVVGAFAGHPRARDLVGRLVELDPHNAEVARSRVDAAPLPGLTVVTGDASTTDAAAGAVPADVVLLCGIFGNVPDEDVHRTAAHASMCCARGATLLWTRHRRDPDLTPAIRGWFADAGFEEVGFDTGGPERWSVGTVRLVGEPLPFEPGVRLFTFR